MDTYDLAPLRSRVMELGFTLDDSNVDGMTINPVGPLAAGRNAEGSSSKTKNILTAHKSFDYADRVVSSSNGRGQGRGMEWMNFLFPINSLHL